MNERIKELRKSLKLTMEEFGKRLGVGKSAINKLEKGENNVTEQMQKSICREFNVNYLWLTEGQGEMFSDIEADIMTRIDYIMTGENDIAKRVFKAFTKLDKSEWAVIEKIIDEIAEKK